MEITEVKVFPIHEEKLKAFVSVVFDQCFMVNDIKVIQGKDGLFISMPSRKKKNGEFKDVAHPLNNGTRRMIESQILAEYDRALEERGLRPADPRAVAPRPLVDRTEATDRGARTRTGEIGERVGRPADNGSAPKTGDATVEQAAAAAPREGTEEKPPEDSLEEVQELHLKDSFWTV
jgi:stage V sporulation protein G